MTARPRAAATEDKGLATRAARFLHQLAKAQRWSPAERDRWLALAERAAVPGSPEARRLGTRLFREAGRLATVAARAEARRLSALYRLLHDAPQAADASGALAAALTALRDGIEFESATGSLLDPGSERLRPVSVFGGHVDLAPGFQFDHGAGLSSWVVKSRRPILLSALRRDGDGPGTDRLASFLCVPILDDAERVQGVLCLGHRRAGAFTPHDRELAVLACRLLAPSLAGLRRGLERTGADAGTSEERLLEIRIGEEERATREGGVGFTLIGLRLESVLDASKPLAPPTEWRHRVAEWARASSGRETSAFALGADSIVLLLTRVTPQATRRLAARLRQDLSHELGPACESLRLATVLFPQDVGSGPAALARLRALLTPLPAGRRPPAASPRGAGPETRPLGGAAA